MVPEKRIIEMLAEGTRARKDGHGLSEGNLEIWMQALTELDGMLRRVLKSMNGAYQNADAPLSVREWLRDDIARLQQYLGP